MYGGDDSKRGEGRFIDGVEYLSLAEAAKDTPYSQEYFSLLARRGILAARKIGRNWFITRDAVVAYVASRAKKSAAVATLASLPTAAAPSVPEVVYEVAEPRATSRFVVIGLAIVLIGIAALFRASLIGFVNGLYQKTNSAVSVQPTSTPSGSQPTAPAIVYVPGPRGPAGPAGATGPKGDTGAAGTTGAAGAAGAASSGLPPGFSIGVVNPSPQYPNQAGTIGAVTYFGSQDITTNTLTVRTGATLASLDVTGPSSLTTLSVSGAATAASFTGDGQNLTLARIGDSTYSTVQDLQNLFHSAGWISGGEITKIDLNHVNVSAGTGLIRNADSATATVFYFDWPAAVMDIPTDSVKYVGIDYNGGSPTVVLHTAADWNNKTNFPLGRVVNESGELHVEMDVFGVGDHAANMILRDYETMPLTRDERDGGLLLGEIGTRNITLTAGALWDRLNRFAINAFDSSGPTDRFDEYYFDGSSWIASSSNQQWPNEQYNDITSGLVTLTNNRYAVLWFYVETDGEIVMLWGRDQYTSSTAAEAEGEPASPPNRIIGTGRLVGRIIFQEGASSATEIQSAFSQVFAAGSLTSAAFTNISNTFTALNVFSAGASVSGPFEVSGTASVSALLIAGRPGLTASVSTNVTPGLDNTYNLGSPALRWSSLYLGPGSLHISSTTGTSGAGTDYTDGILQFTGASLSFGTSAVGAGSVGSLDLTTAGTSRLHVTGAGNVGIGTSRPTALLAVAGTASISNSFFVSSTGNVGIGTSNVATNKLEVVGTASISSSLRVGPVVAASETLEVQGTASVSGNSYIFGNLGIGTGNPTALLSVNGAASISGNFGIGTNKFYVNGSTGNVGIGTKNLGTNALEVAGTASISGTASFGGNVGIAGGSSLSGNLTITNATPQARLTVPSGSSTRLYISSGITHLETTLGGTGNAIQNTGTTYGIATLNGTALTSLSIEFWFRMDSTDTTVGIFQWANSLNSGGPFILLQKTTTSSVQWYVNGNYHIAHTGLTQGTWYHIVLTWDGVTWSSYLNGAAPVTFVGGATNQASAASVYFDNGFNGYAKASIDEARIYSNRVLSSSDVAAHYNSGLGLYGTTPDANLAAGWHFDETSGNAADYSGNGVTMTNNGVGFVTGTVATPTTSPADVLMAQSGGDTGETGIFTFGAPTTQTDVSGYTVRFYTNSVERMRILNTGNVGVGTTAPTYRFAVVGSAGNYDPFDVASASGTSILHVAKGGNVGIGTIRPTAKFSVAGTASISNSFFVGSTGNVGIGTSLPTSKLSVAGTASISNSFFVGSTGNVGIGTSTPDAKFEVVGIASLSNTLNVSGGSLTVKAAGLGNNTIMNVTDASNNSLLKVFSTGTDGGRLDLFNAGATTASLSMSANSTNGTVISVLDRLGSIHIGQTNHNATGGTKLDIRAGADGNNLIFQVENNSEVPIWKFSTNGSSIPTMLIGNASGTASVSFTPNGISYFSGTSANVGIGTTNPKQKLDVVGAIEASTSGNADLILNNAQNQDGLFRLRSVGGATTARFSILGSASAELVTVASTGNVGIATTAPGALLNVVQSAPGGIPTSNKTTVLITGQTPNSVQNYFALDVSANVENSNNTGSAVLRVRPANNGGGSCFGGVLGTGGEMVSVYGDYVPDGTTTNNLVFAVHCSGAAYFLGNVGIGQVNPTALLAIKASVSGAFEPLDIASSSGTNFFHITKAGNVGIGNSAPGGLFEVGTGTTPALVVTAAAGNVGIGTSNPKQKLDVIGAIEASTSGNADLILNNAQNQDGLFRLRSVGGATTARFSILGSASAELVTVASTGNVGIGTNAPTRLLDIAAPSNYSTADLFSVASGSPATNLFIIKKSGNVGIDISTPGALLDVRGRSGATDPFNVSSSSATQLFRVRKNGSIEVGPGLGLGDAFSFNAIGLANTGGVRYRISAGAQFTVSTGNSASTIFGVTSSQAFIGPSAFSLGEDLAITGTTIMRGRTGKSYVLSIQNSKQSVVGYFTDAGNVGIGTTSPVSRFAVVGSAGNYSPFDVASSSTTSFLHVSKNGNVGIGTNAPAALLSVSAPTGYTTGDLFSIASTSPVTTLFRVTKSGNVGIGTAVPGALLAVNGTSLFSGGVSISANLEITGQASLSATFVDLTGTQTTHAVCHPSAGQATHEQLVDCDPTAGADFMEMYPMAADVQEGMIVVPSSSSFVTTTDHTQVPRLEAASKPYDPELLGITSVASQAGDFNSIGHNIPLSQNPKPLALSGRVSLQVSVSNGVISVGDHITSSDIPGVGMKATQAGMTVGVALTPADTDGTILVFVRPGYWAPSVAEQLAALASASGKTTITSTGLPDVSSIMDGIIAWFRDTLDIVFQKGLIQTVKGVFQTVESKNGLTTYDEATGEPYCIKVLSGRMLSVPGTCDDPQGTPLPDPSTPTPTSSPTPDTTASLPTQASASATLLTPTPDAPASASAPLATDTPTPSVDPTASASF